MARTLAVVIILIVFLGFDFAKGDADTTIQYWACNDYTYSDGDPFGQNVEPVLTVVRGTAPYLSPEDYYYHSLGPYGVCYGHAACNSNLSPDDCDGCLLYLEFQIRGSCPDSYGANFVATDCRMRYETYRFLDY